MKYIGNVFTNIPIEPVSLESCLPLFTVQKSVSLAALNFASVYANAPKNSVFSVMPVLRAKCSACKMSIFPLIETVTLPALFSASFFIISGTGLESVSIPPNIFSKYVCAAL